MMLLLVTTQIGSAEDIPVSPDNEEYGKADDLEVVELSPWVGKRIDSAENARFGLLDVENLRDAVILKRGISYHALITLKTGDTFIKTLADSEWIYLQGRVTEIESSVDSTMKPVEFRPDPNRSRLFLMPTGNTLQKGENYFADYELVFVWLARGFTSNFMLDFGFTLLPLTPDKWFYYFGPKVKVFDSGKGRSVACGAHFVALPFMEDDEENGGSDGEEDDIERFWGAAYASVTQEKPGTQVTFGGGVGNAVLTPMGGDLLGAYVGLKKGLGKIKFLGEYWHLLIRNDEDELMHIPNLFAGARFCATSLTVDFGLLYPHLVEYVENVSAVGVPFVNFVYLF
jgi:hypothetical protein